MGETCSACEAKTSALYYIPPVDSGKMNASTFKQTESILRNEYLPTETNKDKKECEESKKYEKKNEVSVMTSKFNQSKGYKKFSERGVELADMPYYSTDIIKQKIYYFGQFVYNKDYLYVADAENKKPIEFYNKYVYKGQWKNDLRNGRGTQQWKDGSIYEGYWKDNNAYGYGRLIHADGDMYIGEWLGDRANGKGIYTSACGARYEGEWRDDKQHGFGVYTWPDEAEYRGEYRNGKKDGKGVFRWDDDSSYDGEFSENNINGYGQYTWKDGRVYEGYWKNNKMDGKGVFTWLDNRRYEGEYVNDKKEGFGIFTFKDGRVYEGYWLNGKQHGIGIFKKKNVSRQGLWENGERVKWLDETKENEVEVRKEPVEVLSFKKTESYKSMKEKSVIKTYKKVEYGPKYVQTNKPAQSTYTKPVKISNMKKAKYTTDVKHVTVCYSQV